MIYALLSAFMAIVIKVPYRHGYWNYPPIVQYKSPLNAKTINTNQNIKHMLYDIYQTQTFALNNRDIPFTIGGDHTISIGSVYASNDYCRQHKKSLGVLWFDSCTDFHTKNTYSTIDRMSVAILCGHTMKQFAIGKDLLDTEQFAYFATSDIDRQEQYRLDSFNMTKCETSTSIFDWIDNFDYIHLSFDAKCITDDANITYYNTICYLNILETLSKSKKLMAVDYVGYDSNITHPNVDAQNMILDAISNLCNVCT